MVRASRLPVRVGVHVARRPHELRGTWPPAAIARGDLNRVVEELGLRALPQLAEAGDAEFAILSARRVHEVIETMPRDLTEHGGDRPLDLSRPTATAATPGCRRLEQPAEREGFAEHRRRLGER